MLQRRDAHEIVRPVDLGTGEALPFRRPLLDDVVDIVAGFRRSGSSLQFFQRLWRIEVGRDTGGVVVDPGVGRNQFEKVLIPLGPCEPAVAALSAGSLVESSSIRLA